MDTASDGGLLTGQNSFPAEKRVPQVIKNGDNGVLPWLRCSTKPISPENACLPHTVARCSEELLMCLWGSMQASACLSELLFSQPTPMDSVMKVSTACTFPRGLDLVCRSSQDCAAPDLTCTPLHIPNSACLCSLASMQPPARFGSAQSSTWPHFDIKPAATGWMCLDCPGSMQPSVYRTWTSTWATRAACSRT